MKHGPSVSFPRWGFGASLLDALHETRRRQAAREIDAHRHLIDHAKVDEMWARLFASH
jgi:tagatose-1,6-bisphosphate aldolase non-catalytic subunit AgaZ/GatZ